MTAKSKHSSLFRRSSIDEGIKFYNGETRKRPPPLQEPASRPQSSFIMDDVLYTSRLDT
jgi:hypothetical protein